MNAEQHTPGPWRVGNGDTRTGYTVVFGENEMLCGGWGLRSLANARLMAAAPELLEALVDVMFLHVPFSDKSAYAEKARAAIAKATEGTL